MCYSRLAVEMPNSLCINRVSALRRDVWEAEGCRFKSGRPSVVGETIKGLHVCEPFSCSWQALAQVTGLAVSDHIYYKEL